MSNDYFVYSTYKSFSCIDVWVRLHEKDLYLSNFHKEKGFFIFKLDVYSGLASMLNPYYKGYNNEGIYPGRYIILDLKEIKEFPKFQKFLIEEDKYNYKQKIETKHDQKIKTNKKASLYTKIISEQLICTGLKKILSKKKQDIIIGKNGYYLLDHLFPENNNQAFYNIVYEETDKTDNTLEFHLWRGYNYGIKNEEIRLQVRNNGKMLYQFIINKDGSCYIEVNNEVLLLEPQNLDLTLQKIFINKDYLEKN